MRPAAFAAILASSTILSGCAGTIAGVSLSSISSFAGFASTIFTGADLGEHAASIVTGKDCRFSEGLLRDDREICEEPGSPATRDDFHGIFVERIEPDGTVIFAAPRYMSASVGAGENENNPDAVWAQIKQQKSEEQIERLLASSNSVQQIDVASLQSGSLPKEALSFLPSKKTADGEDVEGETASQTAARPRSVANAAPETVTVPIRASEPADNQEPPALDEQAFTASLKLGHARGVGGPLISTLSNAKPVTSKLVNGEPVVILRIGPVFVPASPIREVDSASSAIPLGELPTTPVSASLDTAPTSPQALVASLPAKPAPIAEPVRPAPAAKTEAAQRAVLKPKSKPDVEALALTAAPVKPAKVTKPLPAAPAANEEDDVYQPPEREAYTSMAPDLLAAPASAPRETAPAPQAAPAEAQSLAPSDTGSSSEPAPLIPMVQP